VEPNLKGVVASFNRYFKNKMIAVRRKKEMGESFLF